MSSPIIPNLYYVYGRSMVSEMNFTHHITNNSKAIVYDVDGNLIQTYIYNLKKHIWEEQLK